MKILLYLLAAVAGLFGLLSIARTIEHLLVGEGLKPLQLAIGVVGLLLAWIWIKRAKSIR